MDFTSVDHIEPGCGPDDSAYVSVNDLLACYHAPNALGDALCIARPVSGDICFTKRAHVTIQAVQTGAGFTMSAW